MTAKMARPMVASLLDPLLALLLPTEEETRLLRACLWRGAAGLGAWQEWRTWTGDRKEDLYAALRGRGHLLPLLCQALRDSSADVDKDFLPYLRTSYFREELRSQAYRRICAEALKALAENGLDVAVLGGPALAETVYRDWALRHSGSVDLLVAGEDLVEGTSAMQAAGFSLTSSPGFGGSRGRLLRHPSGLPVRLQAEAFSTPGSGQTTPAVWHRTRPQVVAGMVARTLAPEDMLLHVCAQAAMSGTRDTLLWVCDAWGIVHRWADLDWDTLLETAASSRLCLPLSVLFEYLSHEMGMAIPPQVLGRLKSAAEGTDVAGMEVALHGVRRGARSTWHRLLRAASSRQARAFLVRCMLLPSPEWLLWQSPGCRGWRLPLCYLNRPLRHMRRSILRALTPRAHGVVRL
jgi:hypothetical protein